METLLSLRLWMGRHLFGTIGSPHFPRGILISPSRVVKGPCETAEVEALRYIAAHTHIPVPKVFKTHRYRGQFYIEMEYVHGQDLSDAWRDGLSKDEKQQIMQEIAGYIRELRSLTPPREGIVASADSKAFLDRRVGPITVGPFQTHDEFNTFLRGGVLLENCTGIFGERVTAHHTRNYRTCFTHADLTLHNIIVRKGRVAAIIDWGFSGWYPEYWEWTKAHYNMYNIPDWFDLLKLTIPQYDEGLAAERVLWKLYDSPGDAA